MNLNNPQPNPTDPQNDLEVPLTPSTDKKSTNPDKESNTVNLDTRLRLNSYEINPLYARKDQEARDRILSSLRKVKLYPVFNDKNLAKISINYFIYLEGLHMSMKMFALILPIYLIALAIWFILPYFDVSQTDDDWTFYFAGLGILSSILLKCSQIEQDRQLLGHEFLYDLQWGENQFSLLAEGLPLDTNRKEIKDYFNNVVNKNSFDGKVLDVILLQDYYEYSKLVKTIKKNQLKAQTNAKLDKELHKLEEKLLKLGNFKGKAIIIFDKISTQSSIFSYLNVGKFTSFFIFCFWCCFKLYYLRGRRITVRELPEPQDLKFENIHFPKLRKFILEITSKGMNIIILLSVILGLGLIEIIKYHKSIEKEDPVLDEVSEKLSFAYILFTLFLGLILEKLNKIANKLRPNLSSLETQYRMFTFKIYVAIFVYVAVQLLIGFQEKVNLSNQLMKLIIVYTFKKIFVSIIRIILARNPIKEKLMALNGGIKGKIAKKIRSWAFKFNFTKSLGDVLPIIFIGVAFLSTDALILLPLAMLSVYIFALFDKYRMVKSCDTCDSKSAHYMLKHFTIYRYFPPLSFLMTIILLMVSFDRQKWSHQSKMENFIWLFKHCGWGLFTFWISKPLHVRVKNNYIDKNAHVHYDTVCKHFSSFYQRQDPMKLIREKRENEA